jgi:hypothetical protein
MHRSNYRLGTRDEHWQKGKRNEELAARLAGINENEWAVTIRFYAAVHYAHAVLCGMGVPHIGTHDRRSTLIQEKLPGCYNEYAELSERSRDARYGLTPFESSDADEADSYLDRVRSVAERQFRGS